MPSGYKIKTLITAKHSQSVANQTIPFHCFLLFSIKVFPLIPVSGMLLTTSILVLPNFSFSSVQSLSRVRLFVMPWITACQASLSLTNSRTSFKRMSIESVMDSMRCHPAISSSVVPFSSFPQSLPASVFSNESTLHMRWPKYWSFSFSIIPFKEIPGLISFRMDWLDLFAVQGTLKSLLQQYSSKASILRRSAFFTVQLSHPYMTTGKTIALTRRPLLAK